MQTTNETRPSVADLEAGMPGVPEEVPPTARSSLPVSCHQPPWVEQLAQPDRPDGKADTGPQQEADQQPVHQPPRGTAVGMIPRH